MVSFDVESLVTNVATEGAAYASLRVQVSDPGLDERSMLTPA